MSKHYQYIETDGDEIAVHMTDDQLKSLVIDAEGDEEEAANIILNEIYPLIWPDARRGGHTRTIKRRKKGSEYSIYTMEADDE